MKSDICITTKWHRKPRFESIFFSFLKTFLNESKTYRMFREQSTLNTKIYHINSTYIDTQIFFFHFPQHLAHNLCLVFIKKEKKRDLKKSAANANIICWRYLLQRNPQHLREMYCPRLQIHHSAHLPNWVALATRITARSFNLFVESHGGLH